MRTSINEMVKQILKEHKLDFTIIKDKLTSDDNGWKTPYYGLFNSKTKACINTCKAGYRISQNEEIVRLVLEGIKNIVGDLKVHKAGSIHGGRKVYIQLEIAGEAKKVGKKSILKRYVTIIDSNDGSTGLSVGIGDLDMSCENQFFKFYKKGLSKFRHTASLEERIQEIPELVETALAESLKLIKVYKTFESTPITKKLADEMVKAVLGYDRRLTPLEEQLALPTKSHNRMDALYAAIEGEMKEKGMNLWGLHSGVTKWVTHGTKVKMEAPDQKSKSKPKRENWDVENLLAGTGYKNNLASFNFCMGKAKMELQPEELVLS